MTGPQQPPDAQQQQADADSILPTIAMLLAAYWGWRSATNRGELHRQQIIDVLQVGASTSAALFALALRALADQRRRAGRPGDELVPFVQTAADHAVKAGVEAIVDMIVALDDNPVEMPDRARYLQGMSHTVAKTVVHAAQEDAAQSAGWRTKTWLTMQDARVRSVHRTMQGQRVPLGGKFTDGAGNTLDYPGDPTAPPDSWIGCRCWLNIER